MISVSQSPVDLWPSVQGMAAAFVLLGMNFLLLRCPLLAHTVVWVCAFLPFYFWSVPIAVTNFLCNSSANIAALCSSFSVFTVNCLNMLNIKVPHVVSLCVKLVEMLPELATLSDINECLHDGICGLNSYCNNTDGGFLCTCFTGFKANNSALAPGSQNPCTGIPSLCRSLTSLWSRQLNHISYSLQMTMNVLLISVVKMETA